VTKKWAVFYPVKLGFIVFFTDACSAIYGFNPKAPLATDHSLPILPFFLAIRHKYNKEKTMFPC